MTAGWHDLPKAHQSFTDISFLHTLLLRLECDRKDKSLDRCVFLSLMDEDFYWLYVPSILISPVIRNFAVFTRDQSEADVSLMKGARLGRNANDGDNPSRDSVCVFNAEDMAFAMEEMSGAEAMLAEERVIIRATNTAQWTEHNEHRTTYTGQRTQDNVHRTMYTGQRTQGHIGQRTQSNVHRAMYTGTNRVMYMG